MDARQIQIRRSAWAAFLAAGVVALAVHAAMPPASLEQSLLYDTVAATAVLAILAGLAMHAPGHRWPWLALAAGQASFVVGDLLWVYYEQVGESPFPSFADVFYLAGYPVIALALAGFIHRRLGGGDRAGLLDAAILTTGGAVLTWVFLVQPSLAGSELTELELAISLAYPIGDVILIGVATGTLTTPGARTGAFRLLLASLVGLLLADQVYAMQNLEGSYVSGGPIDLVYLASYLLVGAAALHPSMRTLSEPTPVPITWLGPVRLVFLTAAMLSGPAALAMADAAGDTGLWVVAVASAILSLLVLARLSGLVRTLAGDVAKRRTLEERLTYQAFHDPLTDLANRRRFVDRTRDALGPESQLGTVAALFVDLDDFKTVNDTLGHAAGDELLVGVAERLRLATRSGDTAARLGGDEFGILLGSIADVSDATRAADRLLDLLREPVRVAGTQVVVRASIGIAVADAGSLDVDRLLHDADVAMYRAKALGKGRYEVFAADLRDDEPGIRPEPDLRLEPAS